MRFPTVHGDTVVFTYAGDLWSAKLGGGIARRLTAHPGLETRARFSPDGKWIAFTGEYDGNQEVYVIPAEGGEPKRLTFEPDPDEVIGWTPDGRVMYTSTFGFFSGKQRTLYLADEKGALPTRTPVRDISEGSYSADGSTIAYTRGRSQLFNWRRYRGGTHGRVSIYNLKTNSYSELPSGREQSYYPMMVGGSVYYISDKKLGTQNLYRYDLNSKRETQLTKYADADIRFPSTDGKTMVFERDGYLYRYDLASGDTARLSPEIRSDLTSTRPRLRKLSDQVSSLSLSPSGTRVAVEARGELFSLPVRTGETRNLTNRQGSRERFPRWSPDGRTIAYLSDASGNYEVYTQPQLGGEPTQLTTAALPLNGIRWSPDGKRLALTTEANELYLLDVATKQLTKVFKARFGLGTYDFSPDGRYVAYLQQEANTFNAVWAYDVETGKSNRVTSGRYNDASVAFDQTGKYLYVTSVRTFNPTSGTYEFSLKIDNATRLYAIPLTKDTPNPTFPPSDEEPESGARPAGAPAGAPGAPAPVATRIDFEDINERLVPLPLPAGNYGGLTGLAGGVIYVSSAAGQPPSLSRFDLATRTSTVLLPVLQGQAVVNANATKMAYLNGATNQLVVMDTRPGTPPSPVSLDAVEAIVDPRAEWKQIFWEGWRYQRDNFYDPNFLGMNWKAIGDRYAKYLLYVAHRSDLNYVLGLMIGELGTGHAYVSGGDDGNPVAGVPVGQLGADYEATAQGVRFARIYRGDSFDESRRGPLSDPGVEVKEGDYLLAVDGQPVTRDTNPNALLVGKANRVVVLTVNSTPSQAGARRVRVRPLASESQLRYVAFTEDNRRKVEQLSGGRIGYFHVPDTQFTGATEFVRGYYSNAAKDAVVVDDRWNNGGLIQPWFVDTLARGIKTRITNRNAEDSYDALAILGPKAMLINGYAGSGGDFFPYMFRQSKLGPLIGTRTWGGLVGISGYLFFVDGGQISSPEFALTNPETNEIIAENTGIDPDIEVDARPDLIAQGRDPQLERAVEYLMEQLRRQPVKQPRRDVPKVGSKGRIGE